MVLLFLRVPDSSVARRKKESLEKLLCQCEIFVAHPNILHSLMHSKVAILTSSDTAWVINDSYVADVPADISKDRAKLCDVMTDDDKCRIQSNRCPNSLIGWTQPSG